MNETQDAKKPSRQFWLRMIAFVLVCAMTLWVLSINLNLAQESQQAAAGYPDKAAVNELLKRDASAGKIKQQSSGQKSAAETVSADMQKLADAYAIARTEIGNGRYKAALVQVDICLALDDATNQALSVDLWLKKGALHAMLGDNVQAVAGMDKALAIAPATPEAWLAKSQIQSDSGHLAEAITSLLAYIRLEPDDARVYANLAQLHYNIGQYAGAARDCTTYLERRNGVEAAVYFLRGSCRIQLSSFQAACDDFLTALHYGHDAADCYTQAAYCQLMLKNYPAAIEYCTTYLEQIDPENAAILVLRASCLAQLVDYRAAATDYLAAASLGYEKAECTEQVAYCQLMLKDYAAALQSGEQALQLGRIQDTLYQNLGVAALGLQQVEKAAAYFTKSIEMNPNLVMNHYYRGVCRMSLKEYKAAEADFSHSLEKRDMTQVSFYNRGICRIYLKKYADAEKDLKLAISSGSDESIAKSATEVLRQLDEM